MKIKIFPSIDGLDARRWNAMVRDRYPFLRHELLSAMERHGCGGARAGWIARHLGCFDGDELVGAMPLYEKRNSWGEFVFDHAWAEAFHRAGIAYYPKLVNAIPFTPASGQRILTRDDAQSESGARIVGALLGGARELMRRGAFSGLHSLFVADDEFESLRTADAVSRADCQFHWHNRGYEDFEQFLATLKAKKRKNIRHERARARASGVAIQRLDGCTASARDWDDFSALYRGIYQRKYGRPAFNRAFFAEAAVILGEQMQLVIARRDDAAVAAALMYLDDHTLYGRHWGCRETIDCLHFEACYYQGIEICIERGLRRFDPGAQGEHKIARGFAPVRTRSLHWMAQDSFSRAIEQFVDHEKTGVKQYISAVRRHSPYHRSDAAS
ncbi:MAG: GNAT family N-acetyltransferase [bacterium]